jgi:SAM-dependent methyltransferase
MDDQSRIDWKKDSQSFNSVASLYDEFRPGYPQELIDSIVELSGLPKDGRILEVGSGTGIATRLFAVRGYPVHCIEPGGNLAAIAARHLVLYPQVTFETIRFEEWQEQPAEFDLLISAQAFHWVPREIGYAKASRALKPGGSLALFWNMYPGFHGQIALDLDRIYQEIVPELENPKNNSEATIQQRCDDIAQSGYFGPVCLRRFAWCKTYLTREYLGLLSTYSDHIRLARQVRQRLFKDIAASIDAQGGSVKRDYVAVLYVAQKLS